MAKLLSALLLLSSLTGAAAAQAFASKGNDERKQVAAPPEKKPEQQPEQKPAQEEAREKKPAAKQPTCKLITSDAPRGGRLEVEGENFGKAPLVRIAGRVTRMIERTETRIAVQIPRDSDGGAVTVKSGVLEVECGTLTIIGKN